MSIVTIPVWLLLTAAGIPTLCGLFLAWGLLRLKRRRKPTASAQPAEPPIAGRDGFNERIHPHILSQHIDAVFNALTTVIEAERTKLKALAFHTLPPEAVTALPIVTDKDAKRQRLADIGQGAINRDIAACAADGLKADEIAHRLGLSRAEVSLALKLSPQSQPKRHTKLEAVA